MYINKHASMYINKENEKCIEDIKEAQHYMADIQL